MNFMHSFHFYYVIFFEGYSCINTMTRRGVFRVSENPTPFEVFVFIVKVLLFYFTHCFVITKNYAYDDKEIYITCAVQCRI